MKYVHQIEKTDARVPEIIATNLEVNRLFFEEKWSEFVIGNDEVMTKAVLRETANWYFRDGWAVKQINDIWVGYTHN